MSSKEKQDKDTENQDNPNEVKSRNIGAVINSEAKPKLQYPTIEGGQNTEYDHGSVHQEKGVVKVVSQENSITPLKSGDKSLSESLQFDKDSSQHDLKLKDGESRYNSNIDLTTTKEKVDESVDHLIIGENKQQPIEMIQAKKVTTKPNFLPQVSSGPDRMQNVKLPDISQSRSIEQNFEESKNTERVGTIITEGDDAKDGQIKEEPKLSNKSSEGKLGEQPPGEVNKEHQYNDEEKAKLAKYMQFFAKTGDKEERAKAQNEKMKLISESAMGPQQKILNGAAYEFKKWDKFVVFDKNSLCCLYKGNCFRDKAVQLICWPMFDNFIVLMIFINSIFMACYEYNDRNNLLPTNKFIEKSGHFFTLIFTIECVVKITAMGFIHHKNSYLRDSWNWLDFAVVCVGMTDYIPGISGSNLKALRTLRVLRPLRSINKFPSMKKLISSLLASLPALGNAVVFMMFIFLLFCILGVQSFSGVLYQRCRTQAVPSLKNAAGDWTYWPKVEQEYPRLCSLDGSGEYTCPTGQTCGSPAQFKITLTDDDVPNEELIMYGIINYDDIVHGMVTIFQVITLEGWSTLMYNLSDTSPQWMSEIYCLLLVLVGSFFLLNVILAVIMDAFDEVAAQEEELIAKQKADLKQLKIDYGYAVSDSEDEKLHEDTPEERPASAPKGEDSNAEEEFDENGKPLPKKKKKRQIVYPERAKKNIIYKFFFIICSDNYFNVSITACIVLNTILLAMDKYPIKKSESDFQQGMNQILSWIFFAEMVVKLIGLGFKDYAADSFNLFDCSVVMISLIENIIDWIGIDFGGGGAISALRAIRLLRVFKLARSWTSFRELLQKIIITIKDITNISVLMLLFMLIFSLVGSEMYGFKVMYNDEDLSEVVDPKTFKGGVYPRQNFNTLYQGLTTIFIVFIGEDWNSVMYDHYRATNSLTIVYFMFLFIFGNLILLNLFLAILLKNFEEPPGQEEEDNDDEEDVKKVDMKQRIKNFFMNILSLCKKKSDLQPMENTDGVNQQQVELVEQEEAKTEQNEMFQIQADNSPTVRKKRFGLFGSSENNAVNPINTEVKSETEKKSSDKNTITVRTEFQQKSNKGKSKLNFSISKIKQSEVKKQAGPKIREIKLMGSSMMVMNEQNGFRVTCSKIVGHSNFDNFVLFLIIFSTILLAIENPFEYPLSKKKAVLDKLDYILSFTFLFELLIKVVVYGFAFNGPDSYMRNSWNQMDFIIVFFSMVSIAFADIDLGPIKILRVLRVLRPLRMISRNPGMKIAIQSLINAIPDIGNVMVVSLLFILLFAILGTNFYKGKFYKCNTDNVPEEFAGLITNRFDCMDYGGDWQNEDQNFDNIGQSLITLFNVMTTEGWIGVMWNAVDATTIDRIQQKNSDPIQILFFMIYMIACSLFVLNMFVGIVINVFNREKESLYMNHKITQFQREWCDVLVFCYSQKPLVKYELSGNRFKDTCYKIATSYILDNFIFLCIIINTVCLSLTWYNEPEALKDWLENINLVFNIIYTIEAFIKLIAFGLDFFKDGWNSFDFVIVIAAWVGFIAKNIDGLDLGQSTTIIKSFRICRIFKIIKKYKSLRILFYTFIGAIQQLTNVGGLLFLFLFVYSVLGVTVFSGIKQNGAISVHANFENFHNAIITLFRMATGESWHELMYDCARQKSIVHECLASQDYYSVKEFGRMECGNHLLAYGYFISFMVIVSFIFLNLFIAIILESFNTSQNEEGLKIGQQTLNIFTEIWSEFDKKGRGFIQYSSLELIMDRLIEEESQMLFDSRQQLLEGDIEQSEFDNQNYLFNLHKNQYLSGNVLMRQAKIAKENQKKEEEDEQTANVVKISDENEIVSELEENKALSQQELQNIADKEQEQQDTINRLMGYFIINLKVPLYGGDLFYYYDVLEALARDVFQRSINESKPEVVEDLLEREIWSETKQEFDEDQYLGLCKYCYDKSETCPLLCNLTEKNRNRYVDCDQTDEELEEEHDMLVGQLDPVLGKLEEKGQEKDITIDKYQNMTELRATINTRSIENFHLAEYNDAIVDSSQIKAAQIIKKFYQKYKKRKNFQRFQDTARQQLSAKIAAKKLKNKFGGGGSFGKFKRKPKTDGPEADKQPSSAINVAPKPLAQQTQSIINKVDGPSSQLPAINEAAQDQENQEVVTNHNQEDNNQAQPSSHAYTFNNKGVAQADLPQFENDNGSSSDKKNTATVSLRDSVPGNKQGEGAFTENGQQNFDGQIESQPSFDRINLIEPNQRL